MEKDKAKEKIPKFKGRIGGITTSHTDIWYKIWRRKDYDCDLDNILRFVIAEKDKEIAEVRKWSDKCDICGQNFSIYGSRYCDGCAYEKYEEIRQELLDRIEKKIDNLFTTSRKTDWKKVLKSEIKKLRQEGGK